MADSSQSTFRFNCPECFVGLKASAGKVGARLACPSCQANIVVPEAPEVSKPSGAVENHEVYDVRPDDAVPDDREYLTVLCRLCHTRMYATEEEIGRKMTCPDCGTKATVARSVEFAAEKEKLEPVEFDGSTEYAVHEGDWRPPADDREANRAQILVICPLCRTRMHAEESQVGLTIVCPDCQTETLVPAVPDRQPEPEPEDVGEYGVGKPSEVFYPKFAQMLDEPLEEPDTPPGEEPRRLGPPRANPKPRESRPARNQKAPKPPAGPADGDRTGPAEEKTIRVPGKAPTFGRMFTFLAYPTVWPRWLILGIAAAVVAFIPLFVVDLAGGPGATVTNRFLLIAVEMAQVVAMLLGVFWAGMALPACLIILEETAAGTDAIEEWPDFGSLLCLENALAASSLAYCAAIGYVIGQFSRTIGTPDWLGIPLGVFFLFPIVLLSMLERSSLINLFSLEIAGSLLLKWWAWLLFYLQSILLLAALLLVVVPCLWVLGAWAALIAGPWFAAIAMMYFRLMGRLAWHLSGERVPEEPIEPPDLSKLIERGEAEEIC